MTILSSYIITRSCCEVPYLLFLCEILQESIIQRTSKLSIPVHLTVRTTCVLLLDEDHSFAKESCGGGSHSHPFLAPETLPELSAPLCPNPHGISSIQCPQCKRSFEKYHLPWSKSDRQGTQDLSLQTYSTSYRNKNFGN
jgi:hypothetical protein